MYNVYIRNQYKPLSTFAKGGGEGGVKSVVEVTGNSKDV